jgi:hypothetical protein
MDITTFLILITIYLVLIVISMFIEDRQYKIYYFAIVVLGTLCFLNVYLSVIYYIKLRNEPGVPGPRGAPGSKGARGGKGKCSVGESCSFTKQDASAMLYKMAAEKFDTTEKCLKTPSLKNCPGGVAEVERLQAVSRQIKLLESLAISGKFTRQEFEEKATQAFDKL